MARQIGGMVFPPQGEAIHALNNVSVAAGGTEVSAWVEAASVRAVRAVVIAAGANVTVTLEGSPDGGTTVYEIAAAVAGVDQVRDLADDVIRVSAANAGVGAESADVWLTVRT